MTEVIEKSAAQKEFNETYITSTELATYLGVNRVSIFHARARGTLPEPISVNDGQILMWKRADIDSIVKVWKQSIDFRKDPHQAAKDAEQAV